MVGVAFGSLQADSQGQRPLGAVPHLSHEPGELSKWLAMMTAP